ncbi:hypothetical protein HII36_14270 [Nonomuraea sp. NN258]|uniref:hypothetical protein n=1 Tax=Nonomuraea antri TaxID=2730852 RepID=UPI001568B5C2|nr:hypothetical protein [Nonomuraea antri]NRQ32997.1 hypothetical protein [Nonomuraea antri]
MADSLFPMINMIFAISMIVILLLGVIVTAMGRRTHGRGATLGMLGCIVLLLGVGIGVVLNLMANEVVRALDDLRSFVLIQNLVTLIFQVTGTILLITGVVARRNAPEPEPQSQPAGWPQPQPQQGWQQPGPAAAPWQQPQGQYPQGQPAQGQPAPGQYAQGQYAQGQPTQGQHAQGQYAQGQPTQGQYPQDQGQYGQGQPYGQGLPGQPPPPPQQQQPSQQPGWQQPQQPPPFGGGPGY